MNNLASPNSNNPLDPNANTSSVIANQSPLDTTQQNSVVTARASDSKLSAGNGLKGDYYDNKDFTDFKLTRTDGTVNFDWVSNSPAPSIGADTFSVRWTGQVEARYSETYTFYALADDGVRLSVNGKQIINRFIDQRPTESSGKIALVAGQKYDITMEYYENKFEAISKLSWSSSSQAKEIIPQSQLYSADPTTPTNPTPIGKGIGLKGEYYDNKDFTDLKLTRTDGTVNFDWVSNSPAPSIGADTFSVRWTGRVEARYSETYTFYALADDGVRLSVNGKQIVNQFVDQSPTQSSGTIALVAGQKYDISMEYYENKFGAISKLYWSSSSQTKEIIPQSQLYLPVSVPIMTLGPSPESVSESAGNVSITLLRSGDDLSGTSSVKYETLDESAKAGSDYTKTAGTITFAAGETSKNIIIPILNNSFLEPNETFSFVIDQPTDGTLGIQRTTIITIQDDDRSDVNISQPLINEKDGSATITVTRGNDSATASVDYTTVDGTAKVVSDYEAVSGTLNFAVGQTSTTITIPIINDTVGETNESFSLKFSNAIGVTLNTEDTSVISIIDDDPGSFVKETVVSGLSSPTAFDWTPDSQRMFIAQKNGVVKVFDNGKLLSTPFIDISRQVNDTRDRGLLGIAVHPDFSKNPYVYLLFTYDAPEVYTNTTSSKLDDADQAGNRNARLIRVTADANTNYTTAIANSEVVLLGKNSTWQYLSRPDANSTSVSPDNTNNPAPSGILNKTTGTLFANTQDYLNNLDNITNVQDYIASDSESHSIGSVRFGTDGSLFVSIGDGTSYNKVDPRALRIQDIDNLSGKILRIDPITGEGLADNPFYNDDPNSNRSKVYNSGLRNPFRFTVDPKNNTPVIGDVGWRKWEEVNIGKKGANFGWPYFEGGIDANGNIVNQKQPNYATSPDTAPSATALYNSGSTVTAPAYTYIHYNTGTPGNAIVVGDFYTGNTFPSIYQNTLFIGDASKGTVDAVTLNSEGEFVSTRRFASGLVSPVDIRTGDDGNIYYVSLYSGKIERWRSA
ncbi:PA14 domain-containing protein [aff. Roholtiella sp. LEGE 12411]|uniref:PA14 domain-containing protein n=1 Tax=aff. Roholtiella sp. LEGE 12411 TaxID=1828822 RepID=UPI001880542F|nr:PA14 domain-containing protein [aff. Roholtiella sp. LEGE 12411]MBE9035495.1 PQQ-dependent sugar dehydrogenase [aff. Roholtiella sp. LEGE 12411]